MWTLRLAAAADATEGSKTDGADPAVPKAITMCHWRLAELLEKVGRKFHLVGPDISAADSSPLRSMFDS
jgi:hypothetical protein